MLAIEVADGEGSEDGVGRCPTAKRSANESVWEFLMNDEIEMIPIPIKVEISRREALVRFLPTLIL
jgi:hypothetical protein